MALQVELVSPERTLFTGEATMVQARTLGGGDIAFLTGHAPFIGALAIDQVVIRLVDGTDEVAAVHGGFVSVNDDHVKILSDLAELKSQIDVDRARRALERAEAVNQAEDDLDTDAAVLRAKARLKATDQL